MAKANDKKASSGKRTKTFVDHQVCDMAQHVMGEDPVLIASCSNPVLSDPPRSPRHSDCWAVLLQSLALDLARSIVETQEEKAKQKVNKHQRPQKKV